MVTERRRAGARAAWRAGIGIGVAIAIGFGAGGTARADNGCIANGELAGFLATQSGEHQALWAELAAALEASDALYLCGGAMASD